MNPVAPSLSGSSKKLPTFMSNLMSNPPLFVAAVLVFVTIVVALTEAMKKEYQDRVATALATAILDRHRPKNRMIAGVINDGAPPKIKRSKQRQTLFSKRLPWSQFNFL
jgi:hypothetical protein